MGIVGEVQPLREVPVCDARIVERANRFGGGIVGGVADDDQLELCVGLRQDRRERALSQQLRTRAGRDASMRSSAR
jgi:hypothetical protein